jgi:hypothetical protein
MDSGDTVSVTCRGLVMHEPKTDWKLIQTTTKKNHCAVKTVPWAKIEEKCKNHAKKSYKRKSRGEVLTA